MIDLLLEPFNYNYMINAMWVSTLVGVVCAFLSSYLILKGWSLIGDALSHSVIPGVAIAYTLGFPFALGAFISGGLAAGAMLFLSERLGLKVDVIIGLIFTSFFGLGLFIISINPISIPIQTIIMGNILAVTYDDILQLAIIGFISLLILSLKWKDLMVAFFDENHARTIGIKPRLMKAIFFILLSASIVAAMQTVGAFLVIALVIIPGAIGFLLCDRFQYLILTSILVGAITCFFGVYLSFFLDGATGGIIVSLQFIIFLITFLLAPKYGFISNQKNNRIYLD